MKLLRGEKAPEIVLLDQDGKKHTLSSYKGRWVLVYFYPKDNTPGCTREAKEIRDTFSDFEKNNIVVLGISPDSVESHKKFSDKHKLPFTLLADVERTTVQDYGVWGEKSFMGKKYMGVNRTSFLIDPKGNISKLYEKVKPAEHACEVLHDVEVGGK